jgi:hypothetical protein
MPLLLLLLAVLLFACSPIAATQAEQTDPGLASRRLFFGACTTRLSRDRWH